MKRLLFYIFSVVAVVVITDVLFGFFANYQKKKGFKGDYKPVEYVMKHCDEDALIMGSSVVLNSVKPLVIEDSLKLTCFNAGANGQTIIYYRTMLNCILKRYTPKIIILGIRPTEFQDEKILRYNLLVPYYHTGYSEIDSVLESSSSYEHFFLKSNLYRYNTIWFRILLSNFIGENDMSEKGFISHDKPMSLPVLTESNPIKYVSDNKKCILQDIINTCKSNNIKLFIFTPPTYCKFTSVPMTINTLQEICSKNDIPYFNDVNDDNFMMHVDWFYDTSHLNKYGAEIYSKILAGRIKHYLQNE